jgi:hypothetical protein
MVSRTVTSLRPGSLSTTAFQMKMERSSAVLHRLADPQDLAVVDEPAVLGVDLALDGHFDHVGMAVDVAAAVPLGGEGEVVGGLESEALAQFYFHGISPYFFSR